jgi:hypothetical protein
MRANYLAPPEYCKGDSWDHIELVADYCFAVDGKLYWVPAGYEINGASIPRLFWSIIGSPFDPEKIPAAFAHDALYLTHAFTRSEADEVLFQLLLQAGSRLRTARTMWAAVRMFAGFAWDNNVQDVKDLQATRDLIQSRADRDTFKSLWFTPQAV